MFTKLLTALWYKDRYRLSSALPVFGVAFAALGILISARWLVRRADRRQIGAGAVALAWVTALVSALSLVVSGGSAAIAVVFALPPSGAADEVVSVRQIQFLQDAGRLVPDDQRLLGDPWDGSAMSLLFGDREPVFPHVNGQWDPQRLLLAQRLDEIETAPEICEALDALRVRYVIYNPHEFGGGDPDRQPVLRDPRCGRGGFVRTGETRTASRRCTASSSAALCQSDEPAAQALIESATLTSSRPRRSFSFSRTSLKSASAEVVREERGVAAATLGHQENPGEPGACCIRATLGEL